MSIEKRVANALQGTGLFVVTRPAVTRNNRGVMVVRRGESVYVQLYVDGKPAFTSPRLFAIHHRQDSETMQTLKSALHRAGLRPQKIFVEQSMLQVTP